MDKKQEYLSRGCKTLERVTGIEGGRRCRVILTRDGKFLTLCESCDSLGKQHNPIEYPPLTLMELGPANWIGIDSEGVYLFGEKLVCGWCKEAPQREAQRLKKEEEEKAKLPQPPKGDVIIKQAIKEGEVKYEQNGEE